VGYEAGKIYHYKIDYHLKGVDGFVPIPKGINLFDLMPLYPAHFPLQINYIYSRAQKGFKVA
jgi:hypothetical protein